MSRQEKLIARLFLYLHRLEEACAARDGSRRLRREDLERILCEVLESQGNSVLNAPDAFELLAKLVKDRFLLERTREIRSSDPASRSDLRAIDLLGNPNADGKLTNLPPDVEVLRNCIAFGMKTAHEVLKAFHAHGRLEMTIQHVVELDNTLCRLLKRKDSP
jgi:hypothetical protein